jgi:hypothetical protein
MRVADRCGQVMGGTGVSTETIVEQAFREIRAFRIYDGPTEVHKWSLAKKIKRDWKAETLKSSASPFRLNREAGSLTGLACDAIMRKAAVDDRFAPQKRSLAPSVAD